MLDDVVYDVGGRVVDAAGLLDLGLLLDLGAVAGGQPDDLTEELLVDGPQNISADYRELVGALRIV